jgi:hypothetical protein
MENNTLTLGNLNARTSHEVARLLKENKSNGLQRRSELLE